MRKKALVVVDRQALELVLHVDGIEHVVNSASLASCHVIHERHTVPKWVVPVKVGVEREQYVYDGLRCSKSEKYKSEYTTSIPQTGPARKV